jgi:hypothetical protein
MEGVKNNGIALAIVALFLLSSKSHNMKIPIVSTKNSTWAWGTKILEKKERKFQKNMLEWWNFIGNLER